MVRSKTRQAGPLPYTGTGAAPGGGLIRRPPPARGPVARWEARLLPFVLAAALLCASCRASRGGSGAEPYSVWFTAAQASAGGSALGWEQRDLPPDRDGVEGLFELLLSGPDSPDLTSPFPAGTALRSWHVEDGAAAVDLSEAYNSLSGVELSLADACITLTLCQLEGIDEVYLTVEGKPRPFRDQVLSPDGLLLTNGPDAPRETDVQLWFPGGGGLISENRTLSLALGDDPAIAAVQALLAGPETAGAEKAAPEDAALVSLRRDADELIVELNAPWWENGDAGLDALRTTLAGLEPDMRVVLLKEGQPPEAPRATPAT